MWDTALFDISIITQQSIRCPAIPLLFYYLHKSSRREILTGQKIVFYFTQNAGHGDLIFRMPF